MKIKLPDGIKIGNADNGITGVTVVLCGGAVCGCDVRGGAPGTRETALLSNDKANERVDAVCLCGGSAYGLNACHGVMEYLRDRGEGFAVGDKVVPIVSGAVIYDLLGKGYDYPDRDMGYRAAKNAVDYVCGGLIGCGTGATVGKALGIENCCKSGLGVAKVNVGEATVVAVIVLNAYGDVIDNGKIIAGAKKPDGTYADAVSLLIGGAAKSGEAGNTTIGCIITDAKLTKAKANRLATVAHDGLAKTICPVHTDYDGDTLFCISKGDKQVDFTALEAACVVAVSNAVLDAVKL